MKITTRARYAARAVLYLSIKYGDGPIALHTICEDQEISIKYLENIMRSLLTAGIVKSEKGKNGGFALTRPPKDISMGDVVQATEGELATVFCVKEAGLCRRSPGCSMRDVWCSLGEKITEYLKSVNFQDMIERQREKSGGAAELDKKAV
jgi:Rrf2 family transcriptional regulator, cysteine metabolism repressor